MWTVSSVEYVPLYTYVQFTSTFFVINACKLNIAVLLIVAFFSYCLMYIWSSKCTKSEFFSDNVVSPDAQAAMFSCVIPSYEPLLWT